MTDVVPRKSPVPAPAPTAAAPTDVTRQLAKYVVSATLEKAEWNNSTILRGEVAAEVRKLKAEPGGDILVAGSARLVHALQEADLVDEYRLMVFPTVLGSGKRVFADGGRASALRLVEARPTGAVAIMTLHPVREGDAPAA